MVHGICVRAANFWVHWFPQGDAHCCGIIWFISLKFFALQRVSFTVKGGENWNGQRMILCVGTFLSFGRCYIMNYLPPALSRIRTTLEVAFGFFFSDIFSDIFFHMRFSIFDKCILKVISEICFFFNLLLYFQSLYLIMPCFFNMLIQFN